MRRGRRRRRRREKMTRGKTKTRRRRRRPPRPSVGVDASRGAPRVRSARVGTLHPTRVSRPRAGGIARGRDTATGAAPWMLQQRAWSSNARASPVCRGRPRAEPLGVRHPRSPQRPSARGGGSRLPDAARSAEPSTGQISASSLFGRTIFDRLAVRTSARGLRDFPEQQTKSARDRRARRLES